MVVVASLLVLAVAAVAIVTPVADGCVLSVHSAGDCWDENDGGGGGDLHVVVLVASSLVVVVVGA